MSIQVIVKSRSKFPTNSYIVRVAREHAKRRRIAGGIFEIEIVSKKRIQEINKKFRKIDRPTDVLSFPAAKFPGRVRLYGTIFLCSDIIKINAGNNSKDFQAGFDFILSHGIDHLIGIHHKE